MAYTENLAFLVWLLHEVFHLRNVDIYCDNFDNITPALPSGEPDYARANREW